MAAPKTAPYGASVREFVDSIEDDERRGEMRRVMKIMRRVTGKNPKMWGDSIVGYDSYHYVYESGREGDWFITGLSPRKGKLTLYIMSGFERYPELMGKLGKHSTGKSCLYIRSLDDVDESVLEELIAESVDYVRTRLDRPNG